ncbi:MAG TPA: hypothetical protein VEB18_04025 [Candidatus Paceibacterota bacterium]|nr:hypothetical protein [Candidatus Paceibacterota bacterium]
MTRVKTVAVYLTAWLMIGLIMYWAAWTVVAIFGGETGATLFNQHSFVLSLIAGALSAWVIWRYDR